MAQPQYLAKAPRGYGSHSGKVSQHERLVVQYVPIEERTLKQGPILSYYSVRATGKVKRSELRVGGRGWSTDIPASAAALKGVVRQLREQDAEALDRLDREIEELRAAIDAKHEERRKALRAAFAKGHVVRLQDALAVASELADRKARIED